MNKDVIKQGIKLYNEHYESRKDWSTDQIKNELKQSMKELADILELIDIKEM